MAGWDWLAKSGIAEAMIASPGLYIVTNAAHILGICLLVGAIVPLDLRLAGILRRAEICVIAPFLSKTAMAGLGLALMTGAVLFAVNPAEYAANPALQIKLVLIAIAIANAGAMQLAFGRRLAAGGDVPLAARAMAIVSLGIWLAALLAGRWIGFA